jgi:hypothetical protein
VALEKIRAKSMTDRYLQPAILETLAYSDIFSFPLTLEEIYKYLTISASLNELNKALKKIQEVEEQSGYYFLKGNGNHVETRLQRTAASSSTFQLALQYGRILGSMPFVRMVGITGSLAVRNPNANADLDYMLITSPGHLWTARSFAVTFGRMMRPTGHRICVNLLVTENALSWRDHDLYTAREISQMIPITGMDVYQRFYSANRWVKDILPNTKPASETYSLPVFRTAQKTAELFIERRGSQIEEWTHSYQMKRLARHIPTGNETLFTDDVCQGNFDNHRKWTEKHLRERLIALGLEDAPGKSMKGYP